MVAPRVETEGMRSHLLTHDTSRSASGSMRSCLAAISSLVITVTLVESFPIPGAVTVHMVEGNILGRVSASARTTRRGQMS
jgi:hypothetical protein